MIRTPLLVLLASLAALALPAAGGSPIAQGEPSRPAPVLAVATDGVVQGNAPAGERFDRDGNSVDAKGAILAVPERRARPREIFGN